METSGSLGLTSEGDAVGWRELPSRTVLAVLPTNRQADSAYKRLHLAGFRGPDVLRARGAEDGELFDASDNRSLAGLFSTMIRELGAAGIHLQNYTTLVTAGQCLMAARYTTPAERDAAVAILEAAGTIKLGYAEDSSFIPMQD